MAGELQLLVLGEDPQRGRPSIEVHVGQERGFELAHLPRDRLHQLRRDFLRIEYYDEAVPEERPPAEHVDLPEL